MVPHRRRSTMHSKPPPAPRSRPLARAGRILVVLAALAGVALLSAPGASASACGREVIDDWWDGRIDGTYPFQCYDDAIESLPRDVRDYSSAEDDIKRALQAARRGEAAPPNQGESPPREGEGGTSTTPAPPGTDEQPPAGPDAAPPLGESASSVPVPLLILGGLALLLVAGGSIGYLLRRFQRRRLPPQPL